MKSFSVVLKDSLFLFDAAKIAPFQMIHNNNSFKQYQNPFIVGILYYITLFIWYLFQEMYKSCFIIVSFLLNFFHRE